VILVFFVVKYRLDIFSWRFPDNHVKYLCYHLSVTVF
jgi:hypothetical protein